MNDDDEKNPKAHLRINSPGDKTPDTSQVHSRRKNPYRAGRASWRGQYNRPLPERRPLEKTRTFTIPAVSMFTRVTVNGFTIPAVNSFTTPYRNDLNLLL